MVTDPRGILLQSLARTISDFRRNEIAPITPTHIERWLNQFEAADQFTILAEMNSLMKRFYFSRIRVKECLRKFLSDDVLTTNNPKVLLPHVYFLNIQNKGNSQSALLTIVDEILHEDYGCSIAMSGTGNIETYIYIDDCIFTGNRIRYDLTPGADAPVTRKPNSSGPKNTQTIHL